MTFSWFPELSFASPEYFYGLALIPFLWFAKFWADRRSKDVSQRLIQSPRLRQLLVSSDHKARAWVQFILQSMALILWVIAAAQPRYGTIKEETFTKGRNILFAIDTSKSMLATDIAPNRLTRAKLAAQDLMQNLPGDRIGVIAFAGGSFLQAPLTDDHGAVLETINALDYNTIPRGGSSLGGAIKLASETFKAAKSDMNGLVIFSDGQETDDGASKAAEEVAEHIVIITVGVGSEEGEILMDPDSPNGNDYIRDSSGNIVKSKLETAVLQEVATKSRGRFIPLTSNAAAKAAIDQTLGLLTASEQGAKQTEKPIERYQWPLALGIVLFLGSLLIVSKKTSTSTSLPLPVEPQAVLPMKKSLLVAFFLACGASTQAASTYKDLEAGNSAFEQEHYKEAIRHYQSHLKEHPESHQDTAIRYGTGVGNYYEKDYTSALKSFSDGLLDSNPEVQANARQGIGSSLYYMGLQQLEKNPRKTVELLKESLENYDAAIKTRSDDKALIENREFIENVLKELEKQQEQQEKDKQKQNQEKQEDGEKSEQQESSEGEKGDKSDQEGESEGEKSEQNSKNKETDAGIKDQKDQEVPEGELKAGEQGSKTEDKQGESKEGKPMQQLEDQVDEQTGFSPTEARAQLKNYSDDQKTIQYMQRRDKTPIGKDF